MTDPLFEPLLVNRLQVKNRIAMPAMHLNMARRFEVTDRLIDFYAERARGGAGLITVGYATVDELSGNPGNIGAHSDAFIPGLTRLAAAICDNGARGSVQLNHAGRYNHSQLLGGKQPVAPSPVASRLTGETPRELPIEEIQQIVGRFGDAARRVKGAGFDAVEILTGTGYLVSEFLSPLTNRRTDAYGGSFENRMRFGLEVIRAVRAAVGADFPLFARVNGNELMGGGSSKKELQDFAARLVEEEVNALCVNVGWHEAQVPQIVTKVPRGAFAYLARGIKERVGVPVIASHRINDPEAGREMIADGLCDMVAMGRALIADPWLPEKVRTGRERDIVHCVACGQGCFDNLFKMKAVECLANPRAGHEKDRVVRKTEKPRAVMVVGGGPAGMSAAAAAAERGHRVTLFERSSQLGGQLHLAGAPPGRGEFAGLARDLARQLALNGVRAVLEQTVDEKLLEEEKPDAVVLATGGTSMRPRIPGVDLPHVVQAWDVLAGRARTGKQVVVIGGGAVGVETALFLAKKGTLPSDAATFLLVHGGEELEDLRRLAVRGTKKVLVIEMLGELGKNFGKTTRWGMLQDLRRHGVRARTSAKALEITASSVQIEMGARTEEIPADTVVLAVGTQPHDPLQEIVRRKGIAVEVVGDAVSAATALDAIHQGFLAGSRID